MYSVCFQGNVGWENTATQSIDLKDQKLAVFSEVFSHGI